MRFALGFLGVCSASVLLAVSAAMNWQYGFFLGNTEFNGHILGAASAASDGLKALLPFFLFVAIKDKKFSHALAAATLWVVCIAFSMTSALGFAAHNRSDTTGARTVQMQTYTDKRQEIERLQQRLQWVPEHRPAGAVASDIQGMEQNRRWRSTSGCTDATAAASRTFCAQYHELGAELAAGREAGEIEARIAVVQSELAALPADLSATVADPQAKTISSIFGLPIEMVQIGLVILLAVLLELGSSLGFYVALGQWRFHEQRKSVVVARPRARETAQEPVTAGANDNRSSASLASPRAKPSAEPAVAATAAAAPALVAPENDVERFFKERVGLAEGGSLTATALYEDYCDWCEEHGKEPLALPTFGRQFGELGVHKAKIAGRIRYIGIKLNSAQVEDEAPADHKIAAVG